MRWIWREQPGGPDGDVHLGFRSADRLVVPDSVLAQIWRGGIGKQARISALLGLKAERCVTVPLETAAAQRIGLAIGECGHTDVVDVHVALVAREHRAAVITSDRASPTERSYPMPNPESENWNLAPNTRPVSNRFGLTRLLPSSTLGL